MLYDHGIDLSIFRVAPGSLGFGVLAEQSTGMCFEHFYGLVGGDIGVG